jgi:hypothetical protein
MINRYHIFIILSISGDTWRYEVSVCWKERHLSISRNRSINDHLMRDNLQLGLNYKILRIHNLLQTDIFRSKLVSFLLSVTITLAWSNTPTYYGIHTFRIHIGFIVQARGYNKKIFFSKRNSLANRNFVWT